MRKTPMFRRYLRFFGPNPEQDVEDEFSFHLAAKVDELVAQGMSREAAEAEAARAFGDFGKVRDTCRQLQNQNEAQVRRSDYLSGWGQDVVYGFRQLCRRWPTTLLAVLTLGIGVGAVGAVFGIIHAVVLRPLPFADPARIVTVWSTREGRDDVVTPRNFDSWRRDTHSFRQLAALEQSTFTLSGSGSTTQVTGGAVTSSFFPVFGISSELGRTFTVEDDTPPRQHLVVLSHRFWRDRFAADPSVLGQQIHLNREPYTVIGVMPANFDLRPNAEQFWVPLALSGQEMNWTGGVLYVFGHLQPGVTLRQAQAEMNVQAHVLEARYPEMNRGRAIRVGEFAADLVGDYRRQLFLLLAAVSSVFLIACANVANLLLARATGRTRELTIRAALGASRTRLLRQFLTESLMLGLAGAAAGLLFAYTGIRLARELGGTKIPRLGEAGIDPMVLLILVGLAFCCALFSGTLPALRASRVDAQGALVQGGRSVAGLARDRARNLYIAAEVGLALVLLAAAGLLIRSAIAAQNVHSGFEPAQVIAGRTSLPSTVYTTAPQIVTAYERILDTLAAQPGVHSAALTSKVPLGTSTLGLNLKPDVTSPPQANEASTEMQYVSPSYFSTMQIPLVQGRVFTPQDRTETTQVVIVNQTLAGRLWPARQAVGQQMRLPDLNPAAPLREVIGVVADVHENGLMVPAPAVIYLPIAQVPLNPWHWSEQSLYLVARTQAGAVAGPELLRFVLQQVDSELPLGDTLTMDERLSRSIASARFYSLVLTVLGLFGLLLTAAGIYGVVAYFVSRQRAEIGIRMALGSTRSGVMLYVVRHGMQPVLIGVGAGVVASFLVSAILKAQLYGVATNDPLTLIAVASLLVAVATLACYLPARQASKIDPMIALRSE